MAECKNELEHIRAGVHEDWNGLKPMQLLIAFVFGGTGVW
jgi:hypothetical protein